MYKIHLLNKYYKEIVDTRMMIYEINKEITR